MRLVIRRSVAKAAPGSGKLERFRKLLLAHLDKRDREEGEVAKSRVLADYLADVVAKAGMPVGTVRDWKGQKYVKIAPGKWRPKYDSESREAKLAISAIKKKIAAAKDAQEMLRIVLENRDRFSDAHGHPLPFVQELSKFVNEEQDRREAAGKKVGKKKPKVAYQKTEKKPGASERESADDEDGDMAELKAGLENVERAKAEFDAAFGEDGNDVKDFDAMMAASDRLSDTVNKYKALAEKMGVEVKTDGRILDKKTGKEVGRLKNGRAKPNGNDGGPRGDGGGSKNGKPLSALADAVHGKIDAVVGLGSKNQTKAIVKIALETAKAGKTDKDFAKRIDRSDKAHVVYTPREAKRVYGIIVKAAEKAGMLEKPQKSDVKQEAGGKTETNHETETNNGGENENVNDEPGDPEEESSGDADFDAIRKKYRAAKSVTGDEDEITVGKEVSSGHWKLVEADVPTASHDESTFNKTKGFPGNTADSTINDRDYEHDREAQEIVLEVAADYDRRALSMDQPVVVTKDGIVISGNNRTMSSKIAAKKGTDRQYIEALKQRAAKFGLTPEEVGKFKHPRVVFELDHNDGYSTEQFAKFNASDKKSMGPVERAVKVAKTIKTSTVESIAIKISEFESLGELYADKKAPQEIFNTMQKDGIISRFDMPAYITSEGEITGAGKDFLEIALIGAVVNEANIRALNGEGAKSIRQKLVRAITPLIENKGLNGYSVNKELNEGVDIAIQVARHRDKWKNVAEFAKQNTMFETLDPIAVHFAKQLEGTQKGFAEFMRTMNGGLKYAANGEADIFLGGTESRDDILTRMLSLKKAVARAFRVFFGGGGLMGFGLGKRSPIVLSLGKENHEALIERHGQWVRWRRGVKCPCAEKETTQPDPHCERCGGTGYFYTCQKDMIVTQTVGVTDDSGIIEVSEEYERASLVEVYDYEGKRYEAEKTGVYISLSAPPGKSQYLYIVMRQDTLKHLDEAACEDAGGGYFRVQGLQSRRAGIDGLYHKAPGDIARIGRIVDAEGRERQAGELRLDLFTLEPLIVDGEPQEIALPLTARDVDYVPPFIFALLSQNLSKTDAAAVVDVQGDAVVTYPYNCDVSNDDVITALAGTYTQKEVVNRVDGGDDVIGAYFVMDVVSCIGINREYRKGTDYILAGTNRIRWLCDDAPEPGEAYSIVYQICPTYRVVKPIPQLRTSENQRLPKKAVVKLHSTYREKGGVTTQ